MMHPSTPSPLGSRVEGHFRRLQQTICESLEEILGKARFTADPWQREGGGGGLTRVIDSGAVFERGGVNTSAVHGDLPVSLASSMGAGLFFAGGLSIVIHSLSPMVPTVQANFRYSERAGGDLWFGGGIDSIFMSLPPLARWRYDVQPEPGSREAALVQLLVHPKEWI